MPIRPGETHAFRAVLAPKDFAVRCAIAVALVGAAALLCFSVDVLVLVFGGIVVAVALRSLVSLVTRYLHIKGG